MLKSMTKGACALATALTLVGTAAHADNHIIEIADGAYLPILSYVGRGDNLIFKNETQHAHEISAPDGTWTTGVIEPGATYVLNINNHMDLSFVGTSVDGVEMVGHFTYEPAPVSN